jgi:hypothetical protein
VPTASKNPKKSADMPRILIGYDQPDVPEALRFLKSGRRRC